MNGPDPDAPFEQQTDLAELKREFRMVLHILFDVADARDPERMRAVIAWLKSRYGNNR